MPHPRPDRIAEIAARVDAWLPPDFKLRVVQKSEHSRSFATALDFDVTGSGETSERALDELWQLLAAYYGSCLRDGIAFGATLRPVPRRQRFRVPRKPTGRLRRGPFSGENVSAALTLDGWDSQSGGGKDPKVFAHPVKAGRIPVGPAWTTLRAGDPVLTGIARNARLADRRLLELLNVVE